MSDSYFVEIKKLPHLEQSLTVVSKVLCISMICHMHKSCLGKVIRDTS